jgi:hypothetical protein
VVVAQDRRVLVLGTMKMPKIVLGDPRGGRVTGGNVNWTLLLLSVLNFNSLSGDGRHPPGGRGKDQSQRRAMEQCGGQNLGDNLLHP